MFKSPWLKIIVLSLCLVGLTLSAPMEKTLGPNARIIYLHGAWVWGALGTIWTSGTAGLLGLIFHKEPFHRLSRAFGQVGLVLWIIFLAMSLYVMQANWNGLFLDEPRFRIPFDFAVVGLLLQIGLFFLPQLAWTSAANLLYSLALVIAMSRMVEILHPTSPIFQSASTSIRAFFLALLLVMFLLIWQVTSWLAGYCNIRSLRRGAP